MTGGGQIIARELSIEDCKIQVVGSTDFVVKVARSLKVDITGSSLIQYIGYPSIEQNITGSGKIERVE